MKRLLILFLSMAVFAACSSDDDGTQGSDPIIGSWVLVQATPPLDSQFCMDEESTITFNEDETGEATFYLTQMDCEAESSQGNWDNRGNSAYTIGVPVIGDLEGTANFSGNRFTFTTAIGVLTFERI